MYNVRLIKNYKSHGVLKTLISLTSKNFGEKAERNSESYVVFVIFNLGEFCT